MALRTLVTVAAALAACAAFAEAPRVQTGGVGEEERAALDADRGFNLKVVAAARDGDYLAGVEVAVLDARGQRVVGALTEGPWLLAELPPGRYRVVADYGGVVQSRDVAVGRTGRSEVVIHWPAGPAGRR